MQYEYLEVLQDIKILKENHVLLRDNFRTPSQYFKKTADKLVNYLKHTTSVPDLCKDYPKAEATQVYENFTETLIYEQIGSYLIKSMVNLYISDEIDFRKRCL